MPPRRVLLDYAILGLLATEARSGYDVRKVFQGTPIGHYSDSPGSIYPALARLEAAGLIRRGRGEGGRNRTALGITAAGRNRFLEWLDAPVDVSMLSNTRGTLELKLAFYSDHRSTAQLRTFLVEAADVLGTLQRGITAARKALAQDLSPSGQLAISLGAYLLATKAAWLSDAARDLSPRDGSAR